jgi:hypothetical protein
MDQQKFFSNKGIILSLDVPSVLSPQDTGGDNEINKVDYYRQYEMLLMSDKNQAKLEVSSNI